jgi:GNAT superfamily N-acetyltransferase
VSAATRQADAGTSSSRVSVTEAVSKEQREQFIRLPWKLYDRHGPWVPPLLSEVRELLDSEKNPFFQHASAALFLATRDGNLAGRIAAVHNQTHLDIHHDGVGFFGFFESIDDQEVAAALLQAAAGWLSGRGLSTMRGPISPSMNDEIGLLLDDFSGTPVMMMPYNPPYYRTLLEGAGCVKVKDLYAYLATRYHRPSDRQERLGDVMRARHGIEIRNIDLADLDREAPIIKSLYNEAWHDLWGYVPLTDDEVDALVRKLVQFADERMILVAEVQGKPAGFALAIPDVNQVLRHLNGQLFPLGWIKALWYKRRMTGLRLLAVGVTEEYRRKGVEGILVQELFRRGIGLGYHYMEVSWVLEDNALANNLLNNLRFPRYRTYGLFERALQP